MTPSEAHELHAAMRQYGICGAVIPAAPDNLDGVSAAQGRQPERGFVVAR